jgi:hypothetical protein
MKTEERSFEGVTPEFYWYEAQAVNRDMAFLAGRVEHIINTAGARLKEAHEMVEYYRTRCSMLQAELNKAPKARSKPNAKRT